jgi:transposase
VADITDDAPTLDDVIRLYVIGVCVACNWNLNRVAHVLNVSHKTVYNWMNRYMDQGFVERQPSGKGWQLKRSAAA